MAIPGRTVDYGSNEEWDASTAQWRKLKDWWFFREKLYTRGLPVGSPAPQRQLEEKRVDMGTCGDYITS